MAGRNWKNCTNGTNKFDHIENLSMDLANNKN